MYHPVPPTRVGQHHQDKLGGGVECLASLQRPDQSSSPTCTGCLAGLRKSAAACHPCYAWCTHTTHTPTHLLRSAAQDLSGRSVAWRHHTRRQRVGGCGHAAGVQLQPRGADQVGWEQGIRRALSSAGLRPLRWEWWLRLIRRVSHAEQHRPDGSLGSHHLDELFDERRRATLTLQARCTGIGRSGQNAGAQPALHGSRTRCLSKLKIACNPSQPLSILS